MKADFGMERLRKLLPSGNDGTLAGLYINEHGFIFAKTGTLSNHLALSGYLYTKKNRLLAFSFLINNHNGTASVIRTQMEDFIKWLRSRY